MNRHFFRFHRPCGHCGLYLLTYYSIVSPVICSAADHIRNGDADLMLAGGADAAIIPSGIGGFIACRALSQRNDEPARASRPWDRNRDGFVMGEGAGTAFKPLLQAPLL